MLKLAVYCRGQASCQDCLPDALDKNCMTCAKAQSRRVKTGVQLAGNMEKGRKELQAVAKLWCSSVSLLSVRFREFEVSP